MYIERFIKWGKSNPKKLFLVDGFGALTSATLLAVVLVRFEPIFGIPASTLYFLALIPCFFAIYDCYCYFKIERNIDIYLKGIAYSNACYCVLSLSLAFYHRTVILPLGWTYILIEVLIVCLLIFTELRVVRKLRN